MRSGSCMLSLLLYGALALLLVLAFVWAWRSSKNIGSGSAQREAEILARMHSGKDPFGDAEDAGTKKAEDAAHSTEGVESLFAGIPSASVPFGQIDVADVTEAVDIERLLAGESLAVVTRARARLEEPTNLAMEGDTLPPRPAPPPPPPPPPLHPSSASAPMPVGDSWAARAAASALQKKEDAARVFEQQRFSTERETADQIAQQRLVAERMAAERAAQQQRALQLQAEQQEMERQALVRQEHERQEMQRQEWARQELERKQAEQRFEAQRVAALQAEQALMAQRQAQLARQRALETEKSKAVAVGAEQSLDRNLPLRELTLAWFEARGYRSAPASPALRPIELVLRHKDDPARVYGFVVEDARVEVDRVKELREQAKSVGLMRMLIVANVGADPEAYEVLRKKGVRVMDRASVEQEFSELDFSIAAKIIAVARKRAALS